MTALPSIQSSVASLFDVGRAWLTARRPGAPDPTPVEDTVVEIPVTIGCVVDGDVVAVTPMAPEDDMRGEERDMMEMMEMEDRIQETATPCTAVQEPMTAPATAPLVIDTTRTDGRLTAEPEFDPEPARHDAVTAPSHYCREGFELGEILYVWDVPHRRASAVEYIMRAGVKDPAKESEDLRKAIRCLEMELEYMEKYGRRG